MSGEQERAGDGTALLMWSAVLAVVVVAAWLASDPGVSHPPGVLCSDEPQQTPATTAAAWQSNGYRITPLAVFSLRALVLATERYYFDRGADLSPVDFVVGWGAMSDQAVIDRLSISQGRRLARWAVKGGRFPIPIGQISSQAANMHLIPADAEVRKQLLKVRRGHIVRMEGHLVLVEGAGGYRWKSSLSRTDGGNGSCELFRVSGVNME